MTRRRSIAASVGAYPAMAAAILGALVATPAAAGAQTETGGWFQNEEQTTTTQAESQSGGWFQNEEQTTTTQAQSQSGGWFQTQEQPSDAAQAAAPASGSTQRGPNPGATTLNGRGPFAVSQSDVNGGMGAGFNNATVYYPRDTSQGTFAAIAVSPGFLSPKALMQWAGPKIASHGFVVAVMEPNGLMDFPNQRADQMQALLRFLTTSAPAEIKSRIDPNRLGAMGHSMGGGGALEVGDRNNNPRVRAVVGLQPWNIRSFVGMDVPTLIVGASNDLTAAVASHSEPFYNQIVLAEKQYVELSGQGHLVGITDNGTQSAAAIAWFKRYLDGDTRYDRFICPPVSGLGVAETRNSCPA